MWLDKQLLMWDVAERACWGLPKISALTWNASHITLVGCKWNYTRCHPPVPEKPSWVIPVLLPSDWINGNSNKISAVLKLCILWQIRGCCWHCATTPHHTLLSRIQLIELAGSMSDFVCPLTAAKRYTGVSTVTTKSCNFTDLASDATTPCVYLPSHLECPYPSL